MKTWKIEGRTGGLDLGEWNGDTAQDAIAEMRRCVGLDTPEAIEDVLGQTVEEADADLIVTEVAK